MRPTHPPEDADASALRLAQRLEQRAKRNCTLIAAIEETMVAVLMLALGLTISAILAALTIGP